MLSNQIKQEQTERVEKAYTYLSRIMGGSTPRHCRNAITRASLIVAQYQDELSEEEQLTDEFKTLQDIYDFFDEIEFGRLES